MISAHSRIAIIAKSGAKAGNYKKEQQTLPDSLYPELKTIKNKITKLNKWRDNGDIIIDDELLNSLSKEEKNLLLEKKRVPFVIGFRFQKKLSCFYCHCMNQKNECIV